MHTPCRARPQVDTHVHHSACMHQKHLLRFIKSKLRKEPDEVVIFRDGKYLTLREVFESLSLTGCAAARQSAHASGVHDKVQSAQLSDGPHNKHAIHWMCRSIGCMQSKLVDGLFAGVRLLYAGWRRKAAYGCLKSDVSPGTT